MPLSSGDAGLARARSCYPALIGLYGKHTGAMTGLSMNVNKGGDGVFAVVDASDEAAVKAWSESLTAAGHKVDVLINNAGVGAGAGKKVWEVPAEDWANVLDVNVDAGLVKGEAPRVSWLRGSFVRLVGPGLVGWMLVD